MSRLPTFLLPLMLSTAGCVDKSDDTAADTGSGPGATWGDGGSGGDGGADGGADTSGTATDEDGDGYSVDEDCDDTDPYVNPGRVETCDGVDEDCNGLIDDDAGGIYYIDNDGDGFGDSTATVRACDPPTGTADNGEDCDDGDAGVYPGAPETGNSVDDDCDGEIDEGVTSFSVAVTWSSAGAEVEISGGSGSYDFGMAETGAGREGWYGETCIDGDEPDGVDDYGYDVCHSLDATGGEIESVYPDISGVRDGSTLFNQDIGDSGDLTYALFAKSGSDCWVWGDDPGYYDDYGCTEL